MLTRLTIIAAATALGVLLMPTVNPLAFTLSAAIIVFYPTIDVKE